MTESNMLARYRAVYAVQTIGIPDGSVLDAEIAHQENPIATARLVSDALPYCIEIFAGNVLAERLLTRLFGDQSSQNLHEVPEIARQRAISRLNSLSSGRAYLVIDGSYRIEVPNFDAFRDDDALPFAGAFHDTLGPEIKDRFSSIVHRALGAIQLAARLDNPPHVEKIGERAFLFDADRHKPIYLFRAQVSGGSLYGAAPLTEQTLTNLSNYAATQPLPYDPLRSLELLSNAAITGDIHLASFVNAWSAFELFVKDLSSTMPENQDRRLPPLRKMFETISQRLDPENAPSDLMLFDKTYAIRNDLFHEAVVPDLRRPCQDAQELARKYIRLYYSTTD
jgi:hypothetical protein